MLQEIYQQPDVIQTCLHAYWHNQTSALLTHLPAAPPQAIQIIASGTSRHAGLIAQVWLEQLAGIPTRVRSGSAFLTAPLPLTPNTFTLGVTQSGETADTLQALKWERARRSRHPHDLQPYLIGITNQATSSLAKEVDVLLPTLAGVEVGVAATKTFTTQLVVLLGLALHWAKQQQVIAPDRFQQLTTALHQLPEQMRQILQQADDIQALAAPLVKAQSCIVLGSGINHAIALEGALKLKETTYLHAEGDAAGEFLHGPIALLDETIPVIAIAPADTTHPAMLATMSKIKSHRSPLIGIVSTKQAAATASLCDAQIRLPVVDELLSPLLTVIPLQLLAYTIAVSRGLDVDRPRHITKTLA